VIFNSLKKKRGEKKQLFESWIQKKERGALKSPSPIYTPSTHTKQTKTTEKPPLQTQEIC
jgi:hypothetical protein